MERKQCADCGQSSLQDELRCWACGGSRFEIPGVNLAGEPTICVGHEREVTVSWSRSRAMPMAPVYVLCGAACALFTCVVGYWVGRASAPGAPVPVTPQRTAMAEPVTLPTPPTALTSPSTSTFGGGGRGAISGPFASASSPYDSAVVTVRPKAEPFRARPFSPPAATQPPQPLFVNPLVQPRQKPQVFTQPMAPARAAASITPPPAPVQPAPAANSGSAVVMLRNSASTAVEVSIEGPEQWTAVVAPGSAIPVTLSPGTYQLRASGDGARSRRSTLALAASRNYSLVVDRRREGDRDSLVLIEPAIDGQPD